MAGPAWDMAGRDAARAEPRCWSSDALAPERERQEAT